MSEPAAVQALDHDRSEPVRRDLHHMRRVNRYSRLRPVAHLLVALDAAAAFLVRCAYTTPMFRSRLEGSHRRLLLSGRGMPQIDPGVILRVGDHCRFSTALSIRDRTPDQRTPILIVGSNVDLGWQTTIEIGSQVTIGDNVRIAGRAVLAGDPQSPINLANRLEAVVEDRQAISTRHQDQGITLHSDVWLATGCIVAAGVEIGAGTVIAAGSVVTRSLPAGVLAGGNPARILRKL